MSKINNSGRPRIKIPIIEEQTQGEVPIMTNEALISTMLESYKGATPKTAKLPKDKQVSKKAVLGRFVYGDLYSTLSALKTDDVERCKFTSQPKQLGALSQKDVSYGFKVLLAKHKEDDKFAGIFEMFLDENKSIDQQRAYLKKFKAELPKDLSLRAHLKGEAKITLSESKELFSPAGLLNLLVEHANISYLAEHGVEGAFSSLIPKRAQ